MYQAPHELVREHEDGAQTAATKMLPKKCASAPVYQLLLLLFGPRIPRKALVALFQGRASFGEIQGWRFGRRGMPEWAATMLTAFARQYAENMLRNVAALRARDETAGPRAGTRALNHWRAQKEKARHKVGP